MMAMVAGSFAFASAQVAGPQIEFDRTEHDYGEVEQGGDGTTEFVFTNTGTEPLIISKAKVLADVPFLNGQKSRLLLAQSLLLK